MPSMTSASRRGRAKSSACSVPTAPARRRPCASSVRCCVRPAARHAWPATTWPRSQPGAPAHRLHVGQHGHLRSHVRLGDGRLFRPALRHGRGSPGPAPGHGFHHPANERFPRHARGQDEHGHAAESVDRPGHHPRSAGADLRRADGRPGRVGRPGGAEHDRAVCAALGKCILFSTHIMREVERLCDRVAIVSQGRVQACGTLAELRERVRAARTSKSCSFSWCREGSRCGLRMEHAKPQACSIGVRSTGLFCR